jgi:hypothetical protein
MSLKQQLLTIPEIDLHAAAFTLDLFSQLEIMINHRSMMQREKEYERKLGLTW